MVRTYPLKPFARPPRVGEARGMEHVPGPDAVDALAALWPPFDLRVTCGPLVLRPMRDTDFPEVLAVAHAGIHAPDQRPFYFPWTDAQGPALERSFLQYHWRSRAEL